MKSLENFTSSNLIDPKEYGVDLSKSPIAETESWVYKGTDINGTPIALKMYYRWWIKRQIGLKELRKYISTIEKANEHLKGQTIVLYKKKKKNKLKLRANPIYHIGKTLEGEVCSISRFIEGPTIQELLDREYEPLNINTLEVMSHLLNEGIETSHISIIPINVKFLEESREAIITDLYDQVQKLKWEPQV